MTFPSWFMFGAATAAYQIEGAWDVSDKSESIWDRLLHTQPSLVLDNSNGDEACYSYDFWPRDVEIAHELGLQMYRFSISWPRLLPTGFPNKISMNGKNYYSKLIDGLLKKGIQPVVTMYHWDLPQSLQDLGGWTNPLIATWFADYARVLYTLFGDRVKYWITINEPLTICDGGYSKMAAPYLNDMKISNYLCSKHVLLAHAKAFRAYEEFRKGYRDFYVKNQSNCHRLRFAAPAVLAGAAAVLQPPRARFQWPIFSSGSNLWIRKKIKKLRNSQCNSGLVSRLRDIAPTAHAAHKEEPLCSSKLVELFYLHEGRFGHPIYSKTGGWPPELERYIAGLSAREGYNQSRLPPFTPEEIQLVKGSYDFYGLNHFTTRLVKKATPKTAGDWPFYGSKELGVSFVNHPKRKTIVIDWFQIYPEGLRKQLHWIKDNYEVKDIMITENGLPMLRLDFADYERVDYIREYLKHVLLAINDGVHVMGYIVWSMMDSFEWITGYKVKYGLYEVNFESDYRLRDARESAKYYRKPPLDHNPQTA
ncbi:unnamed protein product [Spodoptera littoralis]|uniref:Beta-glucosidase n=1 Tax=Spodoptera littoralis TaxID=7109 RepID=A0A9P0I7G3_SPOLI|nr:unnamed protein product [Spodoptera littoralis]CAH1640805.1 unnamed protein product [Spodoptera littoralis]